MTQAASANDGIVVMMPVYEEWEALRLLLPRIDAALAAAGLSAQVVVIDDGSPEEPPPSFSIDGARAVTEVRVVSLSRNLGHQRAIAIGLSWIQANLRPEAVVVMDGDGEDDPNDVPRLVQACREQKGRAVVFAARARRSENLTFRLSYLVYRVAHRILVGRAIRFGNFSIVPKSQLDRLVSVSELWNHYASAVLKARIPYTEIPTHRARRLTGASKMHLVSLVTHGLSAMSVSGEIVGSRLLTGAIILVGATFLAMVIVVGIHLTTSLALPGWTPYMLVLLFIILILAIMAALMFAFITLSSRNSLGFLPKRDYAHYVMSVTRHPTQPAGRKAGG